ncbi:MAG: hypothetical protein E6J02_06235 [Chloroflexi bacterium]|nr:MAG: hypothetical protein E6J02_06235 [Chloroflexota bacterium]
MNIYRKAYSVVGALLLLEYLGQFYLIAMAVFTVGAAHGSTNPHTIYSAFKNADTFAGLHFFEGMVVIPITTLVLIGLSFAARHPRKTTWQTAGLLGLLVIQAGLVEIHIPLVSALRLCWNNWAFRRQPAPLAAPGPQPEPEPEPEPARV